MTLKQNAQKYTLTGNGSFFGVTFCVSSLIGLSQYGHLAIFALLSWLLVSINSSIPGGRVFCQEA